MKTITDDDGNVYVLKTDMESVIKDRIAKVSARAQQAEEQVRTLQTDLDAAKSPLREETVGLAPRKECQILVPVFEMNLRKAPILALLSIILSLSLRETGSGAPSPFPFRPARRPARGRR